MVRRSHRAQPARGGVNGHRRGRQLAIGSWVASSPPTSVWGAGHCMYRVALFVDHITGARPYGKWKRWTR